MINRQPTFKCESILYLFYALDKNQQQNKMNTNKKVELIKLLPLSSCCNWTKNISNLWGLKTVIGVLSPINPESHLKLIKHSHKSIHYNMHLKSNITLKSDLQIRYKHTSSTYILHMHSKPVFPLMLPLCTITHKARRCWHDQASCQIFPTPGYT